MLDKLAEIEQRFDEIESQLQTRAARIIAEVNARLSPAVGVVKRFNHIDKGLRDGSERECAVRTEVIFIGLGGALQ